MNSGKKRKIMNMKERNTKKNKNSLCLSLKNAPPVYSIHDLIEIGKSIRFFNNIDTVMLWRITPYLEELNKLIGMKSLKESVFYQVIYYLKGLHTRNIDGEYLHTIIMGAPGSGKTTVAKIIGKIYQSMGILSSSGPFKIAHRDDFIAEYLGQTAPKTRKLLTSCLGGVLFVDELYSLAPSRKDKDSFSEEALDTLTAFLSEHKNDFCFIGAGYEDDINSRLLSNNKGLKRRFPWIHKIQEYEPEELSHIFIKMVKDINWDISVSREEIVKIIEKNKNIFKYAGGDIETFLGKAKMMHAKRVFNINPEHKFVLTSKDIENTVKYINKNSVEMVHEPPFGMYI